MVWDDMSNSQILVEKLDYDTYQCYLLNSPVRILWPKGTFTPSFGSAVPAKAEQPTDSSCTVDLTGEESRLVTARQLLAASTAPETRLVEEKEMNAYLSVLYSKSERFNYKGRHITIGGSNKFVQAFHYPLENLVAKDSNIRKEYIDASENLQVFSYEFKDVLCCRVQKVCCNQKLCIQSAFNFELL